MMCRVARASASYSVTAPGATRLHRRGNAGRRSLGVEVPGSTPVRGLANRAAIPIRSGVR
jgi:hypothetical protein